MARIYREMPVNSIWEGAGNIMALDLLRALRKADAAAALAHELAPAQGAHPALDRLAAALPARVEQMATEVEARRLAQDVALAVQAALLYQTAPAAVFARLLRFAPGRQLGPGLRHAAGQPPISTPSSPAPCRADATRTRQRNDMPDLILHHYPSSPFSEKIRLALGYKKLAWKSVIIPAIMPKPDVIALTGGYRKTPILQVGADVYCDTALICDVLEHVAARAHAVPAAPQGRLARVRAVGRHHAVLGRHGLQPAAQGRGPCVRQGAARSGQGLRRGPQGHERRHDPPAARPTPPPPTAPTCAASRTWSEEHDFLFGTEPCVADFADLPLALVHPRPGAGAGRHPERHAGGGRVDGPLAAIGHGGMDKFDSADAITVAQRRRADAAGPEPADRQRLPGRPRHRAGHAASPSPPRASARSRPRAC